MFLQQNLLSELCFQTLAEKAAWDFIKELPVEEKFELAVINPTCILGPVLCGGFTGSQEVLNVD